MKWIFCRMCEQKKNPHRNTSKKKVPKNWIESFLLFFRTKNKIGWAKHWVYFVIVSAWCLYNNRFSYWKCFSCQNDERRSKKIGEMKKENPKFRQGFPMTNSCWWDIKHAQKPIWNCCESEVFCIVKWSKITNNELCLLSTI